MNPDRESLSAQPDRLVLAGIEFVGYATPRPQALGQVQESLGFRPVARQRQRGRNASCRQGAGA